MLALPFDPDKECARGVERPIELTAEGVWQDVSSRLQGALNETTYRTWFEDVGGAKVSDSGSPSYFRPWRRSSRATELLPGRPR